MTMQSQQHESFDLGITRGVRRRRLRSLPALWAAEHFDAAFQEAMRRKEDEVAGRLEVAALDAADGPLFRCIASEIAELGTKMVAADRVLDRAKKHWRKARQQRDRIARRLYRELSEVRSIGRDLLRQEDSTIPCLCGETERDPHRLLSQVREVVSWATDDCPLDDQWIGLDGATLVTRLHPLRKQLEKAIAAVVQAETKMDVPMCKRLRAIRNFDREVPRACRVLESSLEIVGLPTLAMAVRPYLKGTGRVGRPSSRRPVDKHPDLVMPLRTAGLVPEPEAPAVQPRRNSQAMPASKAPVVFGTAHVTPFSPRSRPAPRDKVKTAGRSRHSRRRSSHPMSVWRLVRAHGSARHRRRSASVRVAT